MKTALSLSAHTSATLTRYCALHPNSSVRVRFESTPCPHTKQNKTEPSSHSVNTAPQGKMPRLWPGQCQCQCQYQCQAGWQAVARHRAWSSMPGSCATLYQLSRCPFLGRSSLLKNPSIAFTPLRHHHSTNPLSALTIWLRHIHSEDPLCHARPPQRGGG